jgi:hypothetical protein
MIRNHPSGLILNRNKQLMAVLLCTFTAIASGADDAKKAAKKAEKKPGNAVVSKPEGKERKALEKALESEGRSEEEVRKLLDVITPADRREALRTMQAIQNFVKAVSEAEEKSKSDAPTVEKLLSNRPKKVVEPTSFAAADLDRLLQESLKNAGVKPAEPTDDATFLRRAALDLTGSLPSPEQIDRFEKSTDSDKRAKAVAMLVKSPAFAATQAKYWRDVIRFRATETQQKRFQPQALEKYFNEKFAANKPWDEIAREMITALGPIDDNPAVLLATAQESKPEETAGEVSRVFMGIQIQCAQCHDHPTDSWKRQQFQQFAAFFSGVRTVNFSGNAVAAGQRVFGPKAVGQVVHQVANPKDPTDMQQFAPKFFLDESAANLPMSLSVEGRRAVAASYVAAQDNPWFAKAFINRAWYQLMGDAFYMPVDDIGPEREGKNLEVLDGLATAWTKRGYDIAWLYETIASSQSYQRQSRQRTEESTEAEISGANCPTRLRADQLLQNLRQVTGTPILGTKPVETTKARAAMAKGKAAANQGVLGRALIKAVQTFSFDPSTPDDEVVGTIPQALFMMNAPDLNRAVEARDGSVLKSILEQHQKDDVAALKAIYKRVLAREPNADEAKIAKEYIAEVGKREEAFEDLFWSLLNSAEFLSRR